MSIKLSIFIAFIIQSMSTNNFNNNGHDKALNLQRLSDEHLIVTNSINMEHYKNLSLENIVHEIDGIIYTEEWKDIKGYEGLYQISSFGRVKSIWSNHRIKKTRIYKNGYVSANLLREKNQKTFRLNRLVAIYFIPNLENKPHVNHIDGIRFNNEIYNLEWCTRSENMNHTYHILNKKRKVYYGEQNKNSKPVYQCDIFGNIINKFISSKFASDKLNIKRSSICIALKRNTQTHGFKFRYA